MNIGLSPIRTDTAQPVLSVSGDALTINGGTFDFTHLEEGENVPQENVGSNWIVSDVVRTGGVINLTVLLPHGATAPQETRFPSSINAPDGEVVLPPYNIIETE